MNLQVNKKQNIPLLVYDMESVNSQRNMSSIEYVNYYKEPYYHECGGLITEIYIRAFCTGEKYLGMNYDSKLTTEEEAQAQAQLMDFQNCDFHLIRSNHYEGHQGASCSADEDSLEHNEDLYVHSYLHSDTFDKWLSIIQNRKEHRISFNIKFNQDSRDLFLGRLLMNAIGDYDEEKIYFPINQISLKLLEYESYPKPALSHPTA